MNNGKIVTYEQQKLGLSAYYDKRRVLDSVTLFDITMKDISLNGKFGGRFCYGGGRAAVV